MDTATSNTSTVPSRILLVSHRNTYEHEVWRGVSLELERIIQEVDEVDLLTLERGKWFEQRKNNAMRVGRWSRVVLNPGLRSVRLNKDYDLMFVICEKPSELLN